MLWWPVPWVLDGPSSSVSPSGVSLGAPFLVLTFLGALLLSISTSGASSSGVASSVSSSSVFSSSLLWLGCSLLPAVSCQSRDKNSWDYSCNILVRLWLWAKDPISFLVAVAVEWVFGVNGTWMQSHVIRDRGASARNAQGVG